MIPEYVQAMEPNDESLGGAFGLGRVLADSGIDSAAFSSFYSKTSGGAASQTTSAFDDVDAVLDKDVAYEDDVSDSELPAESAEEVRAREARKAEEERWYQRAMAMQAQAESSRAQEERARKKKERETDDAAKVKGLWPDFLQGKRLKLSEVFYETPRMKSAWAKNLERKKRRKPDRIECKGLLPLVLENELIRRRRPVQSRSQDGSAAAICLLATTRGSSAYRVQGAKIRNPHRIIFRFEMGQSYQRCPSARDDKAPSRVESGL